MRTTSLKSIYLSQKELKVAISDFITHRSGRSDLAFHLDENECEMAWDSDGEEKPRKRNGKEEANSRNRREKN